MLKKALYKAFEPTFRREPWTRYHRKFCPDYYYAIMYWLPLNHADYCSMIPIATVRTTLCTSLIQHAQAFELCESLNAVGAVLDLHKLLENRKALPESKIAVLEALGEISKAAGALNPPWPHTRWLVTKCPISSRTTALLPSSLLLLLLLSLVSLFLFCFMSCTMNIIVC